jgi:hypothetical protein
MINLACVEDYEEFIISSLEKNVCDTYFCQIAVFAMDVDITL